MENNEENIQKINTLDNQNEYKINVSRAENEEPIIQFPNVENNVNIVENPQSANEVSEKSLEKLDKRDEQELNILGKFKSVEQLTKAYENLQAEFTRKSQLLKEALQNKADNLSDKTDLVTCKENENIDDFAQNENTQISEEFASNQNQPPTAKNNFSSKNDEKNAKNTSKTQKNEENSSIFDENKINQQLKSFVEKGQISKKTYLEIANKILQNSKLLDEASGVTQAVLDVLSTKENDFNTKIADTEFIVNLVQNNKNAYDKIINDYVDSCQKKDLPLFMTKNFGASIPASTPNMPTTLSEARVVLEKLLSN